MSKSKKKHHHIVNEEVKEGRKGLLRSTPSFTVPVCCATISFLRLVACQLHVEKTGLLKPT